MKKLLTRFIRDDEGQDLIEYALLGGIIVAAGTVVITAIGARLGVLFANLRAAIGG
jgi:pilus assembly protein Flp/PilA